MKSSNEKIYREPTDQDFAVLKVATSYLKQELFNKKINSNLALIPIEELPYLRSIFNVRVYGIDQWSKLYTDRQLVSALEHVLVFRELMMELKEKEQNKVLFEATATCLALAISNGFQYQCNIATYLSDGIVSAFIQGQSLGMKMDFIEANPLMSDLVGGFGYSLAKQLSAIRYLESFEYSSGEAQNESALKPFLPDGSVDLLATDPPYYDVIPYADCSDFFYVWLKRMLDGISHSFFDNILSRKDEEIVQLAERNEKYSIRTKDWFEQKMSEALKAWRVATKANGKAIIVFAHKDTTAWEALIKAVLDAGWIITASWPVDTENTGRMRANDSAVLSSSIHLICKPRIDSYGTVSVEEVGDWRNVLQELPHKIHEWMPRLSQEGVVGADAIFACLGPALEIYSKFSRVEKANGDKVELKEYLEQVWGAVAKEALNMIFQGAHTEGFEEDARLTAMWLWTISASLEVDDSNNAETVDDIDSDSVEINKSTGFSLEYDAARKIAQGLGAHLENLSSIIEVNGEQARLLPVAERVGFLFGKGSAVVVHKKKKDKENQFALFEELNKSEEQSWSLGDEKSVVGKTILNRLHQAMLLFGAGRGDALRRFLTDEGIGKDERFWRLAQALSALYPSNTDEKRWVDGVLARKKSLGF